MDQIKSISSNDMQVLSAQMKKSDAAGNSAAKQEEKKLLEQVENDALTITARSDDEETPITKKTENPQAAKNKSAAVKPNNKDTKKTQKVHNASQSKTARKKIKSLNVTLGQDKNGNWYVKNIDTPEINKFKEYIENLKKENPDLNEKEIEETYKKEHPEYEDELLALEYTQADAQTKADLWNTSKKKTYSALQ